MVVFLTKESIQTEASLSPQLPTRHQKKELLRFKKDKKIEIDVKIERKRER
jgi:hypothetical protein